jgi:hypothetical protein
MPRPTIERFTEKHTITADGCWLWTAPTTSGGYAFLWVDGRNVLAHRWSYEHHVGPIPDEHELDHRCHTEAAERGECDGGPTCRHRRCVNPEHLEPVTSDENNRRSLSPSSLNTTKTHCPKGHPYAGRNLYIGPNGNRQCRTCNSERNRDAYQARKQRDLATNAVA